MTAVICSAVAIGAGLLIAVWARRWSKRTAARLIYRDWHGMEYGTHPVHTHGAWCHPSAEGCPERPGM